jgi:hypothetical protein
MPESQHSSLHDREQAAGLVAQHYAPQLELLIQLVNYASNLIPRAYNSSEKKMRDVIACYAFLKQFASMLDAVEVLLRAGAVNASFVPARVAFEASLYLEWLLVSDGEKKANYYYVGDIRRQRVWGLRAQKATKENTDFLKEMRRLGEDILANRPTLEAEGAKHVTEAERILALPELADVNAAFDAYKKQHRNREPEWYKVLGKRSLKDIARELQMIPEYLMFYGHGSRVAHSASFRDHLRFKAKGVTASPLRNAEGVHNAFNYTFSTALVVFQRVLAFYRPAELRQFSATYLREWRTPFVNIRHAVVEFKA